MSDDWANVRCASIEEARWMKSVLEGSGIEAAIPDEHTLALPLAPGIDPDAVRIRVRSGDLERAFEVLDARGRWIPGG